MVVLRSLTVAARSEEMASRCGCGTISSIERHREISRRAAKPIMKTPTANPTLASLLDQHTTIGALGLREDDRIRCVACGHRCLIGEGKRGICKVRFNDAGNLKVPFGYVAGLQ